MELSMIRLVERIPDEASAYEFLEELRWNGTPVCAHCDSTNVRYMNPANGYPARLAPVPYPSAVHGNAAHAGSSSRC